MRMTTRIVQAIVALLFIVSGLVKANDPLGLAYKMEEFFELWVDGLKSGHFFAKAPLISLLDFLNNHTLFLAVTMITLEIVTGVALLLGWMKKFILYLLLALIVFFSFLTGYAYLSGKFTNCGCFGDCIPITPKTSFIKDLVLLVLIVFLLFGRRYIQPVFSKRTRAAAVSLSLLFTLLLQWYALKYLPLVDCLPMKKGNNLNVEIKPPKDAVPSVYETRLVYQNATTSELKDMSQEEFNNSKIWEDPSWKWKETKTKLIQKGTDIPRLQNFSLKTLGGFDSTEAVLNYTGYSILYFVNPGKGPELFDQNYWNQKAKQLPVFVITSAPGDFAADTSNNNYQIFTTDGTVFRIAARVNPTIYLLKQGAIINKWPLAKIKQAEQTINELKN
ncbi:MAG: DoxX family protein [Flavisolibacter sp.]|nr:DoxX family protein [Flavisolibacter sp.]